MLQPCYTMRESCGAGLPTLCLEAHSPLNPSGVCCLAMGSQTHPLRHASESVPAA